MASENCGKNAYVLKQVDLTTALTRLPIGERATKLVTLIVVRLPAALTTAVVSWGQKQGFPVAEGDSYSFAPEEDGIFFTWSPNLPGQEALFVMGVDDSGGAGIERN